MGCEILLYPPILITFVGWNTRLTQKSEAPAHININDRLVDTHSAAAAFIGGQIRSVLSSAGCCYNYIRNYKKLHSKGSGKGKVILLEYDLSWICRSEASAAHCQWWLLFIYLSIGFHQTDCLTAWHHPVMLDRTSMISVEQFRHCYGCIMPYRSIFAYCVTKLNVIQASENALDHVLCNIICWPYQ